jgi:hypothetical protein
MTGEHSTRDPRSAALAEAPAVLPPRLAVRSEDRLVLVNVGEIDWIEAKDNYVTIWRGTETLTMRGPLNGLENRLTALTTICGMIPLTFGSSEGMGINFQSFGLVLIGGMTTATLFTILAIPVFYTLVEDAQFAVSHILAGALQDSVGAGPSEPKAVAVRR